MDKNILANQLRERQYKKGIVPANMINQLSDDAIIDSYITCSHCGVKMVTVSKLKIAIFLAKDADHFLQITNEFSQEHVEEGDK